MTIWNSILYFDRSEKWGDPDKMNHRLLYELDRFRGYVNRKIIVHRGYAKNSKTHSTGMAADIHIPGMPLMDQFLAASRFFFRGIGVYPLWNNQGLHLDVREAPYRKTWGRLEPGDYRPLDADFINDYVHNYHSYIISPLSVTMPRVTKKDKVWYLNLNSYRNSHHRTLADAKLLHADVMATKVRNLPKMKTARFVFIFNPATKRKYDLDNTCSIHAKFVIDTIVKMGKLKDDTMGDIVKSIKFLPGDVGPGYVKILIGGEIG